MMPVLAWTEAFTPQDFWLWRDAVDPRISPDGQTVVYVENWNDRTRDATFSNLWIAAAAGNQRRQCTEGLWRDTSPRWSPDGRRIAWISDRSGAARHAWQFRLPRRACLDARRPLHTLGK